MRRESKRTGGGGGGRRERRTAVRQLVLRHGRRGVATGEVVGVEVQPAGGLAGTRARVPVDGDALLVGDARPLTGVQRRQTGPRLTVHRVDARPFDPRLTTRRRRRRRSRPESRRRCRRRRRRRLCQQRQHRYTH